MNGPEPLCYVVRPDRTALWLPQYLADQMGVKWGAHLTADQYSSQPIQDLIRRRIAAGKTR